MDVILGKALEAITLRTHLMSGESASNLSNPDDNAAAIELLARVQGHGISISPKEVEQWALNNGWSSQGAHELMSVAALVTNNPNYMPASPDSPFWQADVIEILEAEDLTTGNQNLLIDDKCKECAM